MLSCRDCSLFFAISNCPSKYVILCLFVLFGFNLAISCFISSFNCCSPSANCAACSRSLAIASVLFFSNLAFNSCISDAFPLRDPCNLFICCFSSCRSLASRSCRSCSRLSCSCRSCRSSCRSSCYSL